MTQLLRSLPFYPPSYSNTTGVSLFKLKSSARKTTETHQDGQFITALFPPKSRVQSSFQHQRQPGDQVAWIYPPPHPRMLIGIVTTKNVKNVQVLANPNRPTDSFTTGILGGVSHRTLVVTVVGWRVDPTYKTSL